MCLIDQVFAEMALRVSWRRAISVLRQPVMEALVAPASLQQVTYFTGFSCEDLIM